jgi:hypothetical protein
MLAVGQRDVGGIDFGFGEKLLHLLVRAGEPHLVLFGEFPELLAIGRHERRELAVLSSVGECGEHGHLSDVAETDDGIPDLSLLPVVPPLAVLHVMSLTMSSQRSTSDLWAFDGHGQLAGS